MTTTEQPNDPLAHYAEQIKPLRAATAKHAAEVEDNRRKLADADAERAECQQAGPPDEALVRKLAEAHIRVELYRNHQAKLESRAVELLGQAEQVAARYAIELKKCAAHAESAARKALIAEVGKLVTNGEREIVQSLNSFGLSAPLTSHEERLALTLRASAEYRRGDGGPFQAFDEMQEAWHAFIAGIAAAQIKKAEPLLMLPV